MAPSSENLLKRMTARRRMDGNVLRLYDAAVDIFVQLRVGDVS